MSIPCRLRSGLLIAAPLAIVISAIAWKTTGNSYHHYHYNKQDTVPSDNHQPIDKSNRETWEKDLDREQESPDDVIESVDDQFESSDWESIGEQVENALRDVEQEMLDMGLDHETIQREIDKSLKSLDMEKINKEISKAVQQANENIDINEIQAEIMQSLNQALEEIRNECPRESMEENDEPDTQDIEKESRDENDDDGGIEYI